jgi:hypothetical protein
MNREYVNSSTVVSVGYFDGTMEVEFKKGEIYQYYGVPIEVYENLFKSESVGKYFAKEIKKEFPYRLISVTKDKEDTNEI